MADFDSEMRQASLMAAAPELLEALKTARSILVDVEGWDTTWPNIQDIDAAIAKAEGTSCAHQWVDARNSFVESGEVCVLCHAIRPGGAS